MRLDLFQNASIIKRTAQHSYRQMCTDIHTIAALLFMFEFHPPKQSSSQLLSYITIFIMLVGFKLICLVVTISQIKLVNRS